MAGQFSANASALGYYYQARYALFLLLDASIESEISIERFDDIAFETGGTPVQLLQAKHHITNTGSLTDYSTDLWKTLRVWSVAISMDVIDPTVTMLTLLTTAKAPDGSAASKLRPASIEGRNATEALTALVNVAKTSTSVTNKPCYDAFLALTETLQKSLFESINVLDSSPTITDVYDKILDKLRISTRVEFLESVAERVEGWWFNKVVQHLSVDSITSILYNELLAKINDIQEEFFRDNLPIDFLEVIAPKEEELNNDRRIFIQQLRLVMVSEPRIRRAINDYYRAFEQRSRWMREDLLGIGELGKYEDRLMDEWERLHEIMKENLRDGADEEEIKVRGRELFNHVDTQLECHIRPRCTTPYVMRGSYHMLANDLRIGWHARFLDRLNKLLSEP
jgi:hypothetical protein